MTKTGKVSIVEPVGDIPVRLLTYKKWACMKF